MKVRHLAVALSASLGLAFAAAAVQAADKPAAKSHTPTAAIKAAKPKVDTSEVVEPEALQALDKMSRYLSTLNSFTATSQASLDFVTQAGQRLTMESTVDYKVRRPDGFVIAVDNDAKKRTYIYDGKQFTIYAPELGFYSTVAAPPTIRQTLDTIDDKFGIQLPLEDLFRWSDPGNPHKDRLKSGFKVGSAKLDGVDTDQYAFREGDIDWQVWIERGDRPLPHKLMIVDNSDPAHPAYSARLTWNPNAQVAASDFTFTPGKDAKAIRMTSK